MGATMNRSRSRIAARILLCISGDVARFVSATVRSHAQLHAENLSIAAIARTAYPFGWLQFQRRQRVRELSAETAIFRRNHPDAGLRSVRRNRARDRWESRLTATARHFYT